MNQRARVLAWALIALCASFAVLAIAFRVAAHDGGAQNEFGATGTLGEFFLLGLPGATFSAVGGLIALRRSENRIGWLCLAIGLLWNVALWADNTNGQGAAEWVDWLGWVWVPALGLTGTLLPLHLPDGRLLSPGWRRYARFCIAVIVLASILDALEPIPGNPAGTEFVGPIAPLFLLLPLSFLGAVGSLVVRYRRSDRRARLQIRWIAFGAMICVAFYLVTLATLLSERGGVFTVLQVISPVWFNAMPVAIAIAILRHRLYDIDLVINRTLVYGLLTVGLAATYFGLVLLLQLMLNPLTSDNALAVAGSTLAVAALFRPARGRIQTAVDRRFYRNRYDAARTLERFSGRLRDEIDLDSLGAELRGVVRETMQPAHVSLWLRGAQGGTR